MAPLLRLPANIRFSGKAGAAGALDSGEVCMRPIAEFAHSGLPADVLQSVSGFKAPSPIQAQAWPLALQGLDMIGIAATGSGVVLLLSLLVCFFFLVCAVF